MTRQSKRFYLDKINGKIFGVCAGLADVTGIDVFWVRLATVLATLAGMGILIPAYIIAAMVANTKPPEAYAADFEQRKPMPRDDIRDFDRRLADIDRYTRTANSRLASEIDKLR